MNRLGAKVVGNGLTNGNCIILTEMDVATTAREINDETGDGMTGKISNERLMDDQ